MQPTGELRGEAVHVAGDARQRFYDSRGYGRPLTGNEIALSRVEAAHLLFRGDLAGVTRSGGDTVGFERFFAESAAAGDRFAVKYLVYADLRDRGFYLSPVRDGWPGGEHARSDATDLIVYKRGSTPDTGAVRYPVQVVGERESIHIDSLAGRTLAIVDEESDITYFDANEAEISGTTGYEPPETLTGVLLSDRVIVWDAPDDLYKEGFYGRPLTGRAAEVEGALQLSLVEAGALAAEGVLSLSRSVVAAEGEPAGGSNPTAAAAAIVARGRAVEGERFDRRLGAYAALRGRDVVPKTGFKFGADFRTYLDVATVDDLPHSTHLVQVVPADHVLAPRELSLDVRLAGGVRKELVFALVADGDGREPSDGWDGPNAVDAAIEWVSIGRLTP